MSTTKKKKNPWFANPPWQKKGEGPDLDHARRCSAPTACRSGAGECFATRQASPTDHKPFQFFHERMCPGSSLLQQMVHRAVLLLAGALISPAPTQSLVQSDVRCVCVCVCVCVCQCVCVARARVFVCANARARAGETHRPPNDVLATLSSLTSSCTPLATGTAAECGAFIPGGACTKPDGTKQRRQCSTHTHQPNAIQSKEGRGHSRGGPAGGHLLTGRGRRRAGDAQVWTSAGSTGWGPTRGATRLLRARRRHSTTSPPRSASFSAAPPPRTWARRRPARWRPASPTSTSGSSRSTPPRAKAAASGGSVLTAGPAVPCLGSGSGRRRVARGVSVGSSCPTGQPNGSRALAGHAGGEGTVRTCRRLRPRAGRALERWWPCAGRACASRVCWSTPVASVCAQRPLDGGSPCALTHTAS